MAGTFIAVVGVSGAGKDTVLNSARPRLEADGEFYFPTRYITRLPDDTSEEHFSISNTEFVQRVRDDKFSLWWSAHDFHYALPDDVFDQLRLGRTVVANISRRSVAEAYEKFANLEVIEITATQETCRKRLMSRARENEGEIMVRQLREIAPDWHKGLNVHLINNEASLSEAVDKFLHIALSLAHVSHPKSRSA